MNALLPLDGIELWHVAGWTMVHFLWLGALVAAAATMCRFFLRRTSPNIRYAFMCAWLLALAALPFGTAAWLYSNSPPLKGGAWGGTVQATLSTAVSTPPIVAPEAPIIELHNRNNQLAAQNPLVADHPDQPVTTIAPLAEPSPNPSLQGRGNVLALLESCIPYLPWLWLVGTPITFALLITGVVGTRRLNRASHTLTEGSIPALLSQLTESLRIGRRVTVAVCDRIAAPVLIGIIRPVILLPPAALTGWSPDEIEMVLLHELAHVRRWDNLANLLQRIVESLLFFHPAVWIVSSWVRSDREACCDALVVRRTNRPHAYAEMLVALAAQMPRSVLFHPAASSAMAAGPLRSRIRRILQLEDDPMLISGKSFTLMLVALAVVATLGVLYVPTIGQAEQSATENVEKNSETDDAKSTGDSTPEPVRIPFKFVLKHDKSGRTRLYMNDQPVGDDVVRTVIGEQGKFVGKLQVSLSAEKGINHAEVKRVLGLLDSLGVKKISLDAPDAKDTHDLPPIPPTNDMLAEALSKNNMKAISIAALNYEASKTSKSLPPQAIYSTDGKPLLSWRVALLPYLGEQELYSQFHLNEPWDSEHNRKLVARIPILYVIPKVNLPPVYAGKTNYLAVAGPECVFDGTAKGSKLQDITDGTANTIAFVEANVDQAVEWTKPDDWQFDRQHPTKGLGTVWTGHWNAAFVDGSQRQISNSTPADAVGIQFTRAGSESKSLAESANRAQAVEGAGAGGPEGGLSVLDGASSKFPSLEDQKLADLAFRRLNLELVPLGEPDLKRVKALGYEGGVLVAGTTNVDRQNILANDLLVGLHVWPTKNLKDVAEILDREDIRELDPLKYYVIRGRSTGNPGDITLTDEVLSGRVTASAWVGREDTQSTNAASALVLNPSPPTYAPVTSIAPTATVSTEELEVLRERVKVIEEQRKTIDELYKTGQKSGSLVRVTLAAYELYLAEGDLALAEGNSSGAIEKYKEARKSAEESLKVIKSEYDSGRITYDRVLQAIRNVSDIKLKLIHLQANPIVTNLAPTYVPANPPTALQPVPGLAPPVDPRALPSYEPVSPNAPTPAKTPFQVLPNAPALNPTDPNTPTPFNAPALNAPPTDAYSLPPTENAYVPNASGPAETPPSASPIPGTPLPAGQPPIDPGPNDPYAALRYRTGEPPTNRPTGAAAPSDKSNLRYDGKTFDQWRNVWQTELSTEKRLQAIKALAAFGRAGYGKEATETILDVAGEYDFYILEGDQAPEGKLKETVLDELTPAYRAANLAQYWVPEIVARMKKDPKKWKWLAEQLFSRLRTKDPDVIAKLQLLAGTESPDIRRMTLYALVSSDRLAKPGAHVDKKTQDLIDAALESKNAEMIRSTLSILPYYSAGMGMGGGGGMASADNADLLYRPALLPLLLDSDEQVRRQARQVVSTITEHDSGDVIEYLLGVLKDKSRERDHLEAVRGLAAVARRGRIHMDELNAVAALQKICKNPDSDNQMFVAALVALNNVFGPNGTTKGSSERSELAKLFGGVAEDALEAIASRVDKMSGSFAADYQNETAIIFNNPDPNTPTSGGGFF